MALLNTFLRTASPSSKPVTPGTMPAPRRTATRGATAAGAVGATLTPGLRRGGHHAGNLPFIPQRILVMQHLGCACNACAAVAVQFTHHQRGHRRAASLGVGHGLQTRLRGLA